MQRRASTVQVEPKIGNFHQHGFNTVRDHERWRAVWIAWEHSVEVNVIDGRGAKARFGGRVVGHRKNDHSARDILWLEFAGKTRQRDLTFVLITVGT